MHAMDPEEFGAPDDGRDDGGVIVLEERADDVLERIDQDEEAANRRQARYRQCDPRKIAELPAKLWFVISYSLGKLRDIGVYVVRNPHARNTAAGFVAPMAITYAAQSYGIPLPDTRLLAAGALGASAIQLSRTNPAQLVEGTADAVFQGTTNAMRRMFRIRGADLEEEGHAPAVLLMKSMARAIRQEWLEDGEFRALVEDVFRMVLRDDGPIHDAFLHLREYSMEQLQEMVDELVDQEDSPIRRFVDRIVNDEHGPARLAIRNVLREADAGLDRISENIIGKSWRRFVGTGVVGILVIITAYYGSKVLWSHIDRVLGRPKLVQESSVKGFFERGPWFEKKKVLPRLVFNDALKERLNGIAKATRTIRERIKAGQGNMKYRNLLLEGPPGTGKTMFARVLAQFSGMDYDIISGASFTQFVNVGEGITEMNKLFERGRRSANGLMIIIDEAEAFLGARMQGTTVSEVTKDSYQLLTNFLHLTGERSDKIMLVFCTNRAEALDPAMKRRVDDVVFVKLPEKDERAGIMKLYRNELLLDPAENTEAFMASVKEYLSNELIDDLAEKTKGLSGGELEGIINALLTDASISDDGLITRELVYKVVQQAMDKHDSFAHGFNHGITAPAA